jgi:glutamyl/glutaminyl-tRNA synthetase
MLRIPPEPNGYLHIGHAKSICLNFGIAQENAAVGAKCHLRFDDTNPEKEETEYVESIKADVKWLGCDWGEDLYFASDYFTFFYDCAVHLIDQPPFPRPPVFAAYFAEATKAKKATTGRPVRPNGSFRSLPQEANS